MHPHEVWEHFAQTDPYWAVLSNEEYKTENLSAEKKQKFFDTGERFIESVFRILNAYFHCPARLPTGLDFGCGVGRLVLPLARRCDLAIGVDVSQTMLDHCAENVRQANLTNVQLHLLTDKLASLRDSPVDLITSCLVFQHIPVDEGMELLEALLGVLKKSGFGYLQITYASEIRRLQAVSMTPTHSYRYYQTVDDVIIRMLKTPRPPSAIAQMNLYNLTALMCLFAEQGINHLFSRLTNPQGILNIEFFFRK